MRTVQKLRQFLYLSVFFIIMLFSMEIASVIYPAWQLHEALHKLWLYKRICFQHLTFIHYTIIHVFKTTRCMLNNAEWTVLDQTWRNIINRTLPYIKIVISIDCCDGQVQSKLFWHTYDASALLQAFSI